MSEIKQKKSEFDDLINELTIKRLDLVKERQDTTYLESVIKLLISEKMSDYQERDKEVLILE
jgi:hypothetical protein